MKIIIITLFFLISIFSLNAMIYSSTPLISETCWSLEVNNNILYELTEWGLVIYDVSDHTTPIQVNRFPVNINGNYGKHLKQLNNYLLVGGEGGTIIYDITTPVNPIELHRLPITNLNDCAIYNNYLIVNNIDYSQSEAQSFLHIYDISVFPVLNATAVLDSTASFELVGNNLFVVNKIHLIGNETNPQAPVRFRQFSIGNNGQLSLVSELSLPWIYQNYSMYYPEIKVYDNQLWVYVRGFFHAISYSINNLQLIYSINCNVDVSSHGKFLSFVVANDAIFSQNGEVFSLTTDNHSNDLSFISHIRRTDATWLNEMITDGTYMYLSFVETGFIVWDITDPMMLEQVCAHNNWQCYMDVKVAGNRLYAVSWTDFVAEGSPSGLYIYDVTNPANPQFLSLYDGSDDYFYSVEVRGDYAYVGGEFGLRILDISNPNNIQPIAIVDNATAREMMFYNNYIITLDMVSFTADAFKVIDITNLNSPVCYNIFNTAESRIPHPYDFEIYQNYMYVLDTNIYVGPVSLHYTGGLKVYDITNPLQPVYVTSLNPNALRTLRTLTRNGNYLYISGNHISNLLQYEIWVVDISSPGNPVIISSYTNVNPYYDLELLTVGTKLFTSGRNILDISDPYHLTMIDSTAMMPELAVGMSVSGDYFYEASFNSVDIYSFSNVAVEEEILPVITDINNYPNPFSVSGGERNSVTTFVFSTDKSSRAELTIYNIKGQKIKTLFDSSTKPGKQSVVWNGTDASGKTVSPGVYLYKLRLNNRNIVVNKCLMLK